MGKVFCYLGHYYKDVVGDKNSFNGEVKYVHELQHALKLCKIKLDVTL